MYRFIIDTSILFLILFLSWNLFNLKNDVKALGDLHTIDLTKWYLNDKFVTNELQSIQNQIGSSRSYIAYFKQNSCVGCSLQAIYFDIPFIYSSDPSEELTFKRRNIPLKSLPNFDLLVRNQCSSGVIGSNNTDTVWQDLPVRTTVNCPILDSEGYIVGFFGVSYDRVIDQNELERVIRLLRLNTTRVKQVLFKEHR